MEIFFAQSALKKDNGVDDPAVKPRPVAKVGVLGGGLMGAGIAFVTVGRRRAGPRSRARRRLGRQGARERARGCSTSASRSASIDRLERDEKMRLVTATTDWSGLEGVDLVIEAVFEDLALKQEMVRAVEAVNPRGIFASNTSSIPIGQIAEASPTRPRRCWGCTSSRRSTRCRCSR